MNQLQRLWINEILPGPLPQEDLADCQSCPMCVLKEEGPDGLPPVVFQPSIKCCSHHPTLPNFLVGGILQSGSAAASVIAKMLQGRVGVFPSALVTERIFPEESRSLRENPRWFGRDETYRCPYALESGLCGIWEFRYSVCATWFCQHVRGERGKRFWDSLRDLLLLAERQVSAYCMEQLDAPPDSLRGVTQILKGSLLRSEDPGRGTSIHSRWWGLWAGREPEFYSRCWDMAKALSWSRILEIGGVELKLMERQVRREYGALLVLELPAYLKVGRVAVRDLEGGDSLVWSYSPYQPVRMPQQIAHLLKALGEVSINEKTRSLQKETLSLLTAELQLELLDLGLLEEANEETGVASKSWEPATNP